ncbi:hypothetical protein ABZ137_03630 [Streptomyces bobili]|uniref:hypothetical protein n=1 Tax=Streptomyces bobili TaxID=67280 RepID=UPI0033BC1825
MSNGIFRSRPRGYRPREEHAEPTVPPPGAAGPSDSGTLPEPDSEATTASPPNGDGPAVPEGSV